MIKLTEILSKPVISLSNCKIEGIVKNAIFDKNFKRIKMLILFDNNEKIEDKSLRINSIYSYGEDAFVIKDDEDLTLAVSSMEIGDKPTVINCNCYTYLGKLIGKITDIYLDEKYYIKSLVVGENLININDIIKTGEDAVIIQDKERKIKVSSLICSRKKVVKLEDIKVDDSQKVYILNTAEKEKKTKDVSNENIIKEDDLIFETKEQENKQEKEINKVKYALNETPIQPKMITANYKILIGRKIERNIYSSNSELIARKNTKITEEIITKARLLNKTRDLIKFSR